ncbi:MAG: phosphate ABC transporter substrate-binding protein PstS [Syntrophales bacterium]|nr:phosphate ABC transporter substrate-binding protein PstS [Syntrophales bacterium]
MSIIFRIVLCAMMVLLPLESLYAQPIISGAGATFPSPLYFKWIEVYKKQSPLRITYRETGSSEGIRLLLAREVDLGGSDIFLSDSEIKKSPAPVLHIPTCVGAVAIIYHLSGNHEIRLTTDVLTDIFLGRITSWRDRRVLKINNQANLPMLKITVVHRSEGSGTTHLLTDYFSKVNPTWRKSVGAGQSIRWPTGVGVGENSGVASLVKKIPGSIGYVSLNYAMKNNLPAVALQNAHGRFIKPDVESVSAAASIVLPPDARIILTNSSVPTAYPICGFSYIILFREQSYKDHAVERARVLAEFLRWAIHDGQSYATPLFYAPLPVETVIQVDKVLHSITYKGKPVL